MAQNINKIRDLNNATVNVDLCQYALNRTQDKISERTGIAVPGYRAGKITDCDTVAETVEEIRPTDTSAQ